MCVKQMLIQMRDHEKERGLTLCAFTVIVPDTPPPGLIKREFHTEAQGASFSIQEPQKGHVIPM